MILSVRSRSARGFSLLELLLVVAVGAVLILAGLGAYRLVSENNNTNQANRLLATLKQQIQQTYQGQASYGTNGIVDDLVALRALPTDLGTTGAGDAMQARGPFGLITITGLTNNFSIAFLNVPLGACIRLGQQYTPQNTNDFISLAIGGTTLNQASAAAAFSQATLATTCSAQAAQNTMTWTFQ